MKVPVYTMQGEKRGSVELPKETFEVPMNADLLHQAVRVLTLRKRRALAHTKTRSEVSGGGRKPWAQKGTGRARHGSIRSPLWRGGGVTFGPRKDRGFRLGLPDRMRRRAFAIALSQKARDGEIIVLDSIETPDGKTRTMAKTLFNIERAVRATKKTKRGSGKEPRPTVTVAIPKAQREIERATRNLPYATYALAQHLDLLDVLSTRYLLFPKDAISVFADRMRVKNRRHSHAKTR